MFTLAGNDVAEIIQNDNFVAIVAIALGCLVGIVGIIGSTVASVTRSKAREQTKRELAAYVAEGTIDPDKAVALLNAGIEAEAGKMKGCKA